jgi:AraC-like DNA-binding protein
VFGVRIASPLRLEKIPAPLGQFFVMRSFRQPFFPFVWHYHPEIELTLIRRGRGLRYAGHSVEPYREGDLCLLEGNLPHSWTSPREGKSVLSTVIQFLPDAGGREFWNLRELREVSRLLTKLRGGCSVGGAVRRRAVERINALEKLPLSSPWRISLFIELFGELASGRGLRPLHPGGPPPVGPKPGRSQALLQIVLRHVEANSAGSIVHQDVANLARLSPPAFCRFFKRQMGKTFSDHVNDVRLARVCTQLADTDRGVIDIAFSCGYTNLAHFNRRFLAAFHCTPRDYRRKISQSGEHSSPRSG